MSGIQERLWPIASIAVASALIGFAGVAASPAMAQQAVAGTARPIAQAAANNGIIVVSGVLDVKVSLDVGPSLPDGTQITFSLQTVANDATVSNSAEFLSGTATVASNAASMNFKLPYTFNVSSRQDTIDVTVGAVGNASSNGISYTNGRQLSQSIPIPKNGATTTINLSGSI